MRKYFVSFSYRCQLTREVNSPKEENRKQGEGQWNAMLICCERKQEQQKTYSNGNRRQGSDSAPLLRYAPCQGTEHPNYLAIALGMSTGRHSQAVG
jgi:hypothetical protein